MKTLLTPVKQKELTCKESLQLLTLVGNDVVGGGDEGAAGTVDAQLQTKIILCSEGMKHSQISG